MEVGKTRPSLYTWEHVLYALHWTRTEAAKWGMGWRYRGEGWWEGGGGRAGRGWVGEGGIAFFYLFYNLIFSFHLFHQSAVIWVIIRPSRTGDPSVSVDSLLYIYIHVCIYIHIYICIYIYMYIYIYEGTGHIFIYTMYTKGHCIILIQLWSIEEPWIIVVSSEVICRRKCMHRSWNTNIFMFN